MELELQMALGLENIPVKARMVVAYMTLGASLLTGVTLVEKYVGVAAIPVPGDVPTYGYGTTAGVKLGDRITPERALIRLLDDLEGIYAAGVKKCVTAPLYQYEYESYVSLAYNIGVPAFCRKAKPGNPPNLIDLINSEQYEAACERIEAFKYGPGRKALPGLVKRRAEERAMCEGKKITRH
jgi:lysozyme